MTAKTPVRVLALLEASSITGTAKAVLEMAYEAKADISVARPIEIFVAIFVRGNGPVNNPLTKALHAGLVPFSMVREAGRFDTSVIPQIRDLCKRYQAHVVWTNSVKSHFLVNQASLGKSCQWVAFHHGYTFTDLKMRLYNELDRFSLPHADRVLTVCKPFAQQLAARGVSHKRIRVQHMPIRPFINHASDVSELKTEFDLDGDAKVILSVGRLSREKGHTDLITAFALLQGQMPDGTLRLLMVGDGPERKKLEQQAKDCGVYESVTFAGHRNDVKLFYASATIFALPSYTEGTPNVLLEAMAAGLPIVATDVGGIPELAVDGLHAMLVPARNPAALAEAMRKLLQSAALRNELSQAAAQVVTDHSPRSYFERMREIFIETVDEVA